MLIAGFTSSSKNWHWDRQFPALKPVWDEVEFVFEGDFRTCDIVFVYDGIQEDLCGKLKAKRSAFIAGEPESVKTYNGDFLNQFDFVLTTDRSTNHPNASYGQLALPWHLGAWSASHELLDKPMQYDDFVDWRPEKTKTLSVVSSNKSFTEGHRVRLDFAMRLKKYFGDEIDLFGRNIRSFGDKMEVLRDYKYHVAIENSVFKDYWSEKLADTFLSLTYPIYHGAPNIYEYFPKGALSRIDINDAESAIRTIRNIIESDVYDNSMKYIEEAKERVLKKYNIFNALSKIAKSMCEENYRSRAKVLASERFFIRNRRKLYREFRLLTGL
ncbi:glycosyltransferase family 10 domain-containing protein [Roseibium sp. M-1]